MAGGAAPQVVRGPLLQTEEPSSLRTIREISSGGIVYRRHSGVTEVVLIRVGSKWRLPKGRVEEGEKVRDTALREVREETGLEGRVVAKLRDISYWYTNRTKEGETIRIFKRVYFYLMRYLRGDVRCHDEEVDEACWLPLLEAIKKLSYPSERETMRKAVALLRRREPEKAWSCCVGCEEKPEEIRFVGGVRVTGIPRRLEQ